MPLTFEQSHELRQDRTGVSVPTPNRRGIASLIVLILFGCIAIVAYWFFYDYHSAQPCRLRPWPFRCAAMPRDDIPVLTKCERIVDEQECSAREDCLAIDLCSPTTDARQEEKCGGSGRQAGQCIVGGFLRCEALRCAGERGIETYYDALEESCADACCHESVATMHAGAFALQPIDGCPFGSPDGLACSSSYLWCDTSTE